MGTANLTDQRLKFREGTVERYRDALNDLIANPGTMRTTEWTRKHRIGSQSVKAAVSAGVVRLNNGYLYCDRQRVRREVVEMILNVKRVRDRKFVLSRYGSQEDEEPITDPVLSPKPVLKRHSVLWGLYTWETC